MLQARNLPAYEQRDKRIRIESPSSQQDANGQPVPTYAHFWTGWAGIEDVSGREYVAAGATQNAAVTKIGIDYLPGVVASMRVVHDSAIYNIEAVLGQDHRSLLLMCKRLA